ncbi:MAG: tRNA pseudouridine(38-40) synthase TruA [Lachnospiraceae bacterium]|nr:tRNA pseudouridine(38-40) synthase TruA [Lachnospiraceae bacterium]
MAERETENQIKRIRLWVSYDGTNYHGWQIQNNGVTIESELNRALSDLYGQDIKVIGASRTDAGVHALGNVAVYDTESPIPAEKVCHALNARLPEDIRVTKSEEVPADWHPRKCASRKTYEYRIYLGEVLPPVKRLYSHHVYRPLDIEAMRKAAAYLVGEHDFKSFCQENTQALSTIRTVYSIDLILTSESAVPQNAAQTTNAQTTDAKAPAAQTTDAKAPDAQSRLPFSGDLILRITGNGFLYNMVRIIAGTLLEVGVGRYAPEEVARILEKKDRAAAGPTAPAKGLTLVKYEFPENEPTAGEPAEE